MAALVAVAHGSRDPRSAMTVLRLLDLVRDLGSGMEVRAAFLELSAPRLVDVLRALHGDGHRAAVVVPLLLGNAYHARVDLPAVIAEATVRLPRLAVSIAPVLGPDSRLESLALRRLRSAGGSLTDRELGVVVAGAGSSYAPANRAVSTLAGRWAASYPWAGALAAFAAAATPDLPAAVTRLRGMGARRIAVASWFLAPGRLPDRIAALARSADPGVIVAGPLGADHALAGLVLDRYTEALTSVDAVQYA